MFVTATEVQRVLVYVHSDHDHCRALLRHRALESRRDRSPMRVLSPFVTSAGSRPCTGDCGTESHASPRHPGTPGDGSPARVLFHAGAGPSDGYTGVDVFFAISGFVITSTLVAELERSGRIGLGRFYMRRVRRLLPALALMLVVVTALGTIAAPLAAQRAGGMTGIFAALFAGNLYLANPQYWLLRHGHVVRPSPPHVDAGRRGAVLPLLPARTPCRLVDRIASWARHNPRFSIIAR